MPWHQWRGSVSPFPAGIYRKNQWIYALALAHERRSMSWHGGCVITDQQPPRSYSMDWPQGEARREGKGDGGMAFPLGDQ